MKKFVAFLLMFATSVALAACSESDRDGGATREIASSESFNQADVDFATDMIQHHAQALTMADLVRDREVSAELTRLAEEIRMAQAPEIELMVEWLNDWGRPAPETGRDHSNAHDGMGMGDSMPGMMSTADMDALASAQDEDFESMWLRMMIEHHEGAITMAETEKATGKHPEAIDLAATIIAAQQREINEMADLLDP